MQNSCVSEDNIPGPKQVVHVVKSHETIDGIANHYHVMPQQIYFWNNKHKNLSVGEELTIWQPTSKHLPLYHRVRRSESLSTIAHHYRTTVSKLHRLHHISGNTIRISQRLVV